MAVESSLNSRNERIYIEVLVHHINLSSHKIHDEGTSSLCVCAEFIDLPSVEIRQGEFVSAKKAKDESHPGKNCIDFSSGKSCLFVEPPSSISKNMNLKPLKIEVISKKQSQFLPLCETHIFFSDCNYKEGSSILEDRIRIPILGKNIYDLMDHQGASGTIELSLNLISRKSSSSVNEFQNLKSGSKMLPKIPERDLPIIEAPKTPPKAKMGDPEFENLTCAEKLNDSSYRSSIYKTYPNEPTCGCENEYYKKSSNESCCPEGCTTRCCSSKRNSEKKIDCASSTVRSKRLRGGGEGVGNLENIYKMGHLHSNIMCNNGCNRRYHSIYASGINIGHNTSNMRFRLGGGGEEEPTFNDRNIDSNNPSAIQTNGCCCCPDKEVLNSVMQRRSDQQAIKKPCLGVDCLIKAFNDAQKFVDSIGKVSGLAGLGLMDPSESPYFGRSKEDDEAATKESKTNNLAPAPTIHNKMNRTCTGVCNTKRSNNTSMFSGRMGVIREVIPDFPSPSGSVVPGAKVKKKDEKLEKQKEGETSLVGLEESGPCGDPKCRSKRKRINIDAEVNGILKGSSKQKVSENNSKIYDKFDKGKNKYISGPSGDRNASKLSEKIGRKITKFVYSACNIYPGLSCGHKTCVESVSRVPPNMGWMWHPEIPLGRLKPRIGWKPGAINARLRQVLREVKANFWQGGRSRGRPKSVPSRSRRGISTRRKRSFSSVRKEQTETPEIPEEEWKEPPPTLHIHRKDGVYYVTMYPIKQDAMVIPKLEEPTKPLQFKIVKNRDDASDVSSSTASDMEIEFSPPAAVNRYRKKPDVIHVETQVKQQEILDAYKPPGSKKTEKKSGKEKKTKK